MSEVKEVFQSTKMIDGFSTCFRQWKATDTHCSFLHGYAIKFKVTFQGELDYRNWVVDFGFMKRSKTPMHILDGPGSIKVKLSPDDWFKYMFDHTVLIAMDDSSLIQFAVMQELGVIQLRVIPTVGCEMFAKLVFDKLNEFLFKETEDRVRVVEVECFEHEKNSAIYKIQ